MALHWNAQVVSTVQVVTREPAVILSAYVNATGAGVGTIHVYDGISDIEQEVFFGRALASSLTQVYFSRVACPHGIAVKLADNILSAGVEYERLEIP